MYIPWSSCRERYTASKGLRTAIWRLPWLRTTTRILSMTAGLSGGQVNTTYLTLHIKEHSFTTTSLPARNRESQPHDTEWSTRSHVKTKYRSTITSRSKCDLAADILSTLTAARLVPRVAAWVRYLPDKVLVCSDMDATCRWNEQVVGEEGTTEQQSSFGQQADNQC